MDGPVVARSNVPSPKSQKYPPGFAIGPSESVLVLLNENTFAEFFVVVKLAWGGSFVIVATAPAAIAMSPELNVLSALESYATASPGSQWPLAFVSTNLSLGSETRTGLCGRKAVLDCWNWPASSLPSLLAS